MPPAPGPEALGELLVAAPDGQLVPCRPSPTSASPKGPAVINRESLERRVLVEVNVRGRDSSGSSATPAARSQQVHLPRRRHVEWGGQFENFRAPATACCSSSRLRSAVIFGMLFLMFGDVRYAVAVFAGAPFALIGGVLALVATRAALLHPRGGRLHRRGRRRRPQRRGAGERSRAGLDRVDRATVAGGAVAVLRPVSPRRSWRPSGSSRWRCRRAPARRSSGRWRRW